MVILALKTCSLLTPKRVINANNNYSYHAVLQNHFSEFEIKNGESEVHFRIYRVLELLELLEFLTHNL